MKLSVCLIAKNEEEYIENALLSSGRVFDEQGIAKVRAAANSFGEARAFYKEGMRKFEEIANVANLNAIRNEIRNGVRVNPAGLMDRLVKPNNPDLLRRAESSRPASRTKARQGVACSKPYSTPPNRRSFGSPKCVFCKMAASDLDL